MAIRLQPTAMRVIKGYLVTLQLVLMFITDLQ